MKRVVIFLLILSVAMSANAAGIKARFNGNSSIDYKVYYNGFKVGKLQWEYLGKDKIEGKEVDVLMLNSDANIFKLLNIQGDEKVFLDSNTRLPVKVERDIVYFGKNELIEEFYDQEGGHVRVIKNNCNTTEQILDQEGPIHHILALLYFFPKDHKMKEGDKQVFNLPTQKINIKLHSERMLKTKNGKRDTYLLVGRGAKRFNLWLDKEEMTPLRLEFIMPLGKISIVREYESDAQTATARQ